MKRKTTAEKALELAAKHILNANYYATVCPVLNEKCLNDNCKGEKCYKTIVKYFMQKARKG